MITARGNECTLGIVGRDEDTWLWTRLFLSSDGEHGFRILATMWSPKSDCVAFQLESSGDHQAWFAPIFVYDVASGRATDRHRLPGEKGATMVDKAAPREMRLSKDGVPRFLGRCEANGDPHRHSWDPTCGELHSYEE